MRYFLFLIFFSPLFAQEAATVRFSKLGSAHGVEITLIDGYKTYWRYVGDSGIPPVFDFSASLNVKNIEVHYPTPLKFSDGFGFAIGYKQSVFFPLDIEKQDVSKPVALKLQLEYAVCEKVCLPASSTIAITLNEVAKLDLSNKVLNIPTKQENLVAFVSQDEKQITFSVKASQEQDILVEGENEKWALPFPKFIQFEGDKAIYTLKKEGQPRGESFKGAQLRLTLLSEQASETFLQLP